MYSTWTTKVHHWSRISFLRKAYQRIKKRFGEQSSVYKQVCVCTLKNIKGFFLHVVNHISVDFLNNGQAESFNLAQNKNSGVFSGGVLHARKS